MPDDAAREFAAQSRCLVVAAAGCGKTELIARAILECSEGPQLVLTHTHAGVRALRDRLRLKRAPPSSYAVDTIAGFSLRYAASFPRLSGGCVPEPCTSDDWLCVYEAASRCIHQRHIRDILKRSYAGVFVDEYQDCTKRQHELISALCELLPTRIVGDPLQGIFEFSKDDPLVNWASDVYPVFNRLGDLDEPHRWRQTNPALGHWLLGARNCLLSGQPIHVRDGGPVKWVDVANPKTRQACQIRTCLGLLGNRHDSIAVLRKWPQQAHATSKVLKGSFRSMEEVECRDLLAWCERVQAATGLERASLVVKCALACMTKKPQALDELGRILEEGQFPGDHKLKKLAPLKSVLREIADTGAWLAVSKAFRIIAQMPEVTLHRKELYREMVKATSTHEESSKSPLRSTAWRIRDGSRRFGRFVDPRVVSRTTLVKGLEFDHVVLVDAGDFDDAKNLYVALTRGAKSLTVMSAGRTLQRPNPGLSL